MKSFVIWAIFMKVQFLRILYFLVFLIPIISFSQQKICITNAAGEPLRFVKVSSTDNQDSYTDKDGCASISHSTYYRLSLAGFQVMILTRDSLEFLNFSVSLQQEIIFLDNINLFNVDSSDTYKEEILGSKYIVQTKGLKAETAYNTADLLEKSSSVYIQRSQLGGGSPVIRGFEASRILLLVNGIRMNTATTRSGHFQGSIATDPLAMERIDLYYGPSSLGYGSDALGGAINFITSRSAYTDSMQIKNKILIRYASAEKERTVANHFSVQKQLSVLDVNLRLTAFGDLMSGKSKNFFYDTTWLRPEKVLRINGTDSIVRNSSPYLQYGSGFNQYDGTVKYRKKMKQGEHELFGQFSTTSDVPRYDRLSGYVGKPSFSVWNYGPQTRTLSYYKLSLDSDSPLFNLLELTPSFQYLQESRITRRYRSNTQNARTEHMYIPGMKVALYKSLSKRSSLHYGADSYYNIIKSSVDAVNINTGELLASTTRYPSAGSTYLYSGLFAEYLYKHEKLTLHLGARFDMNRSSFKLDTIFNALGLSSAELSNTALSGAFGANYQLFKTLLLSTNFQTGFRSPNIDDLAKVFDSQPGSLTVPNPNLKSERTLSTELNVKYSLSKVSVELGAYFSRVVNLISIRKTQLDGQDSVFYDGILSAVSANGNNDFGVIYGYGAKFTYLFSDRSKLLYSHTYTRGYLDDHTPLAHIPPAYGKMEWEQSYLKNKLKINFSGNYNLRKKLTEYNREGEDRLESATAIGMPAFLVFDFLISYELKNCTFSTGVKNILDTHYRTFSSGINGSGRSLFFVLSSTF